MTVQFENFEFSYLKGGKPYFAPNDLGRRIGRDIKAQVEVAYEFDPFVYHLRAGGHVAALHCHRSQEHFAKADIRRFFYSISRSRVQRALADVGIARARHYAKWSCVRNPFGDPNYALPYGFIQSPILATLVLMESVVGVTLRQIHATEAVVVSLYMDDIALSSNDLSALEDAFEAVLAALAEANFELSTQKVCPPSPAVDLFNCDLQTGHTQVRQERIDEFNSVPRSPESVAAFDRYCDSVEEGNNQGEIQNKS